MKIRFLILLAFASFALWSCNKNDDSTPEKTNEGGEQVIDNAKNNDSSNSNSNDNQGNNNSGENTNTPENKEPVSENAEDNLPEKTRAFVGAWMATKSHSPYKDKWKYRSAIIFFSDGTCVLNESYYCDYNGGYDIESEKTGYWTYDENTRILATTVGYQWNITLSNSSNWTGLLLTGDYAENTSFEKNDAILLRRFKRIYETWECTKNVKYIHYKETGKQDKDTTLTFTFNGGNFSYFKNTWSIRENSPYVKTTYIYDANHKYMNIQFDDETVEIKNNVLTAHYYGFYYKSYDGYYVTYDGGTLTIKNFYSDNPILLPGLNISDCSLSETDEYTLAKEE